MTDLTDNVLPPVLKLGKKAAKLKKGVPAFATLTATMALPTPPPEVQYSMGLKHLGMMGNSDLGDCTCAGVGHAIQLWTSLTRDEEVVIPDKDIIKLYSDSCGYKPGDENTDNGGIASDVLQYWYNHPIDGHELAGFASIRPGNRTDVRDAIWLFGVCYVGVQLPIAAQNSPWDITPGTPLVGDLAPGSWGGHLIPVVDYDVETLTCITWGTLKKLSWAWWDSYTDEAFALLSKDWIENSGHAPPGFDMTTLAEHMKALRH